MTTSWVVYPVLWENCRIFNSCDSGTHTHTHHKSIILMEKRNLKKFVHTHNTPIKYLMLQYCATATPVCLHFARKIDVAVLLKCADTHGNTVCKVCNVFESQYVVWPPFILQPSLNSGTQPQSGLWFSGLAQKQSPCRVCLWLEAVYRLCSIPGLLASLVSTGTTEGVCNRFC